MYKHGGFLISTSNNSSLALFETFTLLPVFSFRYVSCFISLLASTSFSLVDIIDLTRPDQAPVYKMLLGVTNISSYFFKRFLVSYVIKIFVHPLPSASEHCERRGRLPLCLLSARGSSVSIFDGATWCFSRRCRRRYTYLLNIFFQYNRFRFSYLFPTE